MHHPHNCVAASLFLCRPKHKDIWCSGTGCRGGKFGGFEVVRAAGAMGWPCGSLMTWQERCSWASSWPCQAAASFFDTVLVAAVASAAALAGPKVVGATVPCCCGDAVELRLLGSLIGEMWSWKNSEGSYLGLWCSFGGFRGCSKFGGFDGFGGGHISAVLLQRWGGVADTWWLGRRGEYSWASSWPCQAVASFFGAVSAAAVASATVLAGPKAVGVAVRCCCGDAVELRLLGSLTGEMWSWKNSEGGCLGLWCSFGGFGGCGKFVGFDGFGGGCSSTVLLQR